MLQCAPGMLATVMVEHLSTEAGYDALALFDGEDITRSPPLGVLTGEVDNGAVTSSTDSLSIRGWESVVPTPMGSRASVSGKLHLGCIHHAYFAELHCFALQFTASGNEMSLQFQADESVEGGTAPGFTATYECLRETTGGRGGGTGGRGSGTTSGCETLVPGGRPTHGMLDMENGQMHDFDFDGDTMTGPFESFCLDATAGATAGRNRSGVQGSYLNPLGLFSRTSTPFIWRILSAFLPA